MRRRPHEPLSGHRANEITELVTKSSPSCMTYPPIAFSNSVDPRTSPAMPAHLQTWHRQSRAFPSSHPPLGSFQSKSAPKRPLGISRMLARPPIMTDAKHGSFHPSVCGSSHELALAPNAGRVEAALQPQAPTPVKARLVRCCL